MRNVKHGTIQSAVRAAIKRAGGLECVSADLGMSVANLSRASGDDEDRPGGLGVNHLHRLGRIIPEAVEPIAEHFSHLAGGVFLPLVPTGQHSSDLSKVMSEFADVMRVHADAMSENSKKPFEYTRVEAEEALAEVDEAMSALAVFRASLVSVVEA